MATAKKPAAKAAAKKPAAKKAAAKPAAKKAAPAKKAAAKPAAKKAAAKPAVKKAAAKPVAKKAAAKPAAKKAAPAKKVAAKKPAAKKVAKPKTPRKPNAAFMKPMTPSATLGAVIGANPLPRTEVTKKVWDYIKKNKLQDQANKRMINADDKLKAVFGGKKHVSMSQITKLFYNHRQKAFFPTPKQQRPHRAGVFVLALAVRDGLVVSLAEACHPRDDRHPSRT